MIAAFDNDPGVTHALAQWRSRSVFPTDFASLDLRGLSAQLRLRSIFSARCTNAGFIEEVARVVDDMLSGKINMATGRWELMQKLAQLGYDPEVGFPQDMADIPPAEKGSLRDLSSETRLNLMLETNQRVAANYGRMVAGNGDYARREYPAWELVRLFVRRVPRGTPESRSAGWDLRWQAAGDAVAWGGALQSPMIALKDSPLWPALGEGEGGYQDTLDNPFPPFAFNSGMAWRAVNRARCVELGLIEGDQVPGAMEGQLAPQESELDREIKRLSGDLQKSLEKTMEREKAAQAEVRRNLPEIQKRHEEFVKSLL